MAEAKSDLVHESAGKELNMFEHAREESAYVIEVMAVLNGQYVIPGIKRIS